MWNLSNFIPRALKLDGYYSLGNWVFWVFTVLTGITGATVMAWAFSLWDWFWKTCGWAGVLSVGLMTWFIIVIGIFLLSCAQTMRLKSAYFRREMNMPTSTGETAIFTNCGNNKEIPDNNQIKIDPCALNLSKLDIIQDEGSNNVDLTLGLIIANFHSKAVYYKVDYMYADFNGVKGDDLNLKQGSGIIRHGANTMYNYRSVSVIPKKDQIIHMVLTYSIVYGEIGRSFTRRWSCGVRFSFNPAKMGEGYRYIFDYERDEALSPS